MKDTSQSFQKKDSPAYRSKSYLEMASRWPYVSDVIKGTLHLREQKEKYLPKFPAEDNEVYEDRRKTAVCFDATGKTRNGLVGLILRKDPTLSQETPQVIKDHLENVDLAGTHWNVFAKEVAEAAWEYGHSLILVDMQPSLEPGATLEDERKAGRRPYWIHYKPDQVINWNTVLVNGQTILEQITFEECSTEKDGRFGQKDVTRYRVLFLEDGVVKWELHRKDKDASGKEEIVLEDQGTFKNVTEIPVSVAYSRKTGFLTSCPPLLNLALLNIKHYQQSSELDNTLHIVGYPMLCSDDADADETTVKAVGPAVQVRVPAGRNVWYAEPSGSSLAAQRQNLEDKKQEMAVMGISFLAERVNVEQTATEQTINHGERTSDLATMARSLKDTLERSLGFQNQFLGGEAKAAGTVEMADPSELVLSSEDLRLLSDLVMRGQLDVETLWAMMLKAGRLPSNFNATLTSENIGKLQPTI
jgi:hypothetical protein